jgi:hypothetical protein
MKKNSKLAAVITLASIAAFSAALRAQDAPPMDQGGVPPPPEQLAPSDQGTLDQGAPDQGDQDTSGPTFQTFYDDLGSQGNWMQTDNYGYVWQPNVQDPDWRPYSDGNWVYTDDGWTWVAAESEPWGWATYHYGRWANLDGVGWVWVPGYTWAPAWVSWRYGGGYCGWAPLPPETSIGIDFGSEGDDIFHIGGDCDTAYDIGSGCYNFIPVAYIGARDYRPYYLNRYNNYAVINNTRNVTNIAVARTSAPNRFGRVTTGGPSLATVNAQSRTPVPRASLVSSNRVGNGSLQGNQLAVFAPQVRATATARPRTVAATLSAASVNRGTDISRPLTVNPRLAPGAPSPQQIQAARDAQAKAPRNARIATTGTQLTGSLATPLTALQPHVTAQTSVHPTTTNPGANSSPRAVGDQGESAFTGGNSVHHTQSQTRDLTPAPVSHHDAAPVQHTFVQPQGNPEPPHTASPPVEHHQAAPPSQSSFHPAPAPPVHQPPPGGGQHASGGGAAPHPASGKPDDKDGKKDDDKNK